MMVSAYTNRMLGTMLGLLLSTPFLASAHEVYVLSPEAIKQGMTETSLNVLGIASAHFGQFAFWAFLSILVVSLIFFISISQKVERVIDPILFKIKRYAPLVIRLTIGVSFVSAAYHGAFLAPELPLDSLGVANAGFLAAMLGGAGALMIFGVGVRVAALVGLGFFASAFLSHGAYPIIYMDFLSALIFLVLVGGHSGFLERFVHKLRLRPSFVRELEDRLHRLGTEYGFAIVRIGFGFSLVYAAYYGKYLYSGLALETVKDFGLAQVFGFEPGFLVLGAFLLEALLGVFFILGIELRFAVIFATTFLTLSQLYFKEAVWPHLVLFGIAIALFMHGYDKYSLEGRFFRKEGREPVL